MIRYLKIDVTHDYDLSDFPIQQEGLRIFSVYAYDTEWRVHCCELTPSYKMRWIEDQYALKDWNDIEDPKLCEEADDWLSDAMSVTELCSYMHCREVDAFPDYQEGTFPEGAGGSCLACSFEKARENYDDDEGFHNAQMEAAVEYAQGNQV